MSSVSSSISLSLMGAGVCLAGTEAFVRGFLGTAFGANLEVDLMTDAETGV